jgi:hypothetical protein
MLPVPLTEAWPHSAVIFARLNAPEATDTATLRSTRQPIPLMRQTL